VLVYTSTIGLEAACMGKPVIVAGLTHYADKGFTLDASTPESFLSLLESATGIQSNPVARELALRYAHLFFIRAMIPHETFLRADRLFCVTDFPFRSLQDLAAGQNAQLDVICDVIFNSRAPLLP
jgi:hypothetical protein